MTTRKNYPTCVVRYVDENTDSNVIRLEIANIDGSSMGITIEHALIDFLHDRGWLEKDTMAGELPVIH